MRLSILLLLFSLYLPTHALADDAKTVFDATPKNLVGTDWTKLKIPPGTKIVITKDKNGVETKALKFSGGVVILDDGTEMDNSGKGAVVCVWKIYTEVHNELEICDPDNKKLKTFFGESLDRINNFIVANSLTGQSKASLQGSIDKAMSTMRGVTSKMHREDLDKWCKSGLLAGTEKAQQDKLKSQIDEMLSVPRPPVLNPCL